MASFNLQLKMRVRVGISSEKETKHLTLKARLEQMLEDFVIPIAYLQHLPTTHKRSMAAVIQLLLFALLVYFTYTGNDLSYIFILWSGR